MVFSYPGFFPWIIFGLFTIANVLLSYFHFSLQAKLWVVILGLVIPAVTAWMTLKVEYSLVPRLTQAEFLPPVPSWGLGLLVAAAVFLRFHHLTSLSLWPLEDEA